MPDGPAQRRHVTTVETLGIATLIIGVVALIYATGLTFGIGAGRDELSSRELYQAEKDRAVYSCTALPPSSIPACLEEALEGAQAASDSRQDLFAQKDMARYSLWMVVAAFLSLGITAVGVYFVKRTLDATLVAVEDTSAATKAMVRQNDLSEQAQRAWITTDIRPVMWSPERDEIEFTFDAVFRNIGKSTAEFHAAWDRFHPVVRDTVQEQAITKEVVGSGIPILPNQEIEHRARVVFPKTEPMSLIPYVLITVIYFSDGHRYVGSYAYRIEAKAKGVIWGGALLGDSKVALGDKIDPKPEHSMTVIK